MDKIFTGAFYIDPEMKQIVAQDCEDFEDFYSLLQFFFEYIQEHEPELHDIKNYDVIFTKSEEEPEEAEEAEQ